jgi:hypothetical protein
MISDAEGEMDLIRSRIYGEVWDLYQDRRNDAELTTKQFEDAIRVGTEQALIALREQNDT